MFLNFNVLTDGKLTHEDIEINYEQNYVRVATPALDGAQSMVMIHDYTQVRCTFTRQHSKHGDDPRLYSGEMYIHETALKAW